MGLQSSDTGYRCRVVTDSLPSFCRVKMLRLISALVLILTIGVGQVWADKWVKVTSEPASWEGEYLLVYESSSTSGSVWTGIDANNCYVSATISSGEIASIPEGGVSIVIASVTGGYSIKVNGGTNNNKYIYGTSGDNKLNFSSTAQTNTISYSTDHTEIVNSTSHLRWNTSGSRFRYYKSSSYSAQETTQLYKKQSATLSSITITTQPTKLVYLAGETFSSDGAVVTATMSNSTTKTVSATWTPTGTLSAGLNQTVTASYTENAVNKTATTTINVYSVNVQVVDEDGTPLSEVGMPSASATGRNITASAKGNNYVFKTWEFVGSNNGLSFGTATNRETTLSGTPTGNVTIKAVYHKPIAVTWKVNGKAWTPSAKSGVDGTAEVGYGEQVSTLPTDPTTAEFCGQKFMGWTKTEIGSTGLTDAAAISALNLFTTVGDSPAITTETTFHAVFADYGEE